MEIEAMEVEMSELIAKKEELCGKIDGLKRRITDAKATFKIGDRVTYDGAKHVWQITGIGIGLGCRPKYIGAKLKKDGKPSLLSGVIHINHKIILRAA